MEIVTTSPINPNDVYRLIKSDKAGSIIMHFAVVRGKTNEKTTSTVEFRATKDSENIKQELHGISDEIIKKYEVDDVVIIRALGRLNVGDVMSLVATSSPHREAAFDACRYGVERLKEMKAILKKETFK